MKLTQLRLAGHGAWLPLSVDGINPELMVLTGPHGAGTSTVASLAAHLLYGKTGAAAAPSSQSLPPLAEGSLEVESHHGRYRLRRHRDGSPHGRLSIAAASGAAVEGGTIRTLLSGLSPRVAAELYAVDFARAPQALNLLEGDFAREFALAAKQSANAETGVVCQQHAAPSVAPLNRRRVDELISRRDDVVRQIESQMSDRRRESGVVSRELAGLDATLSTRRQQAEKLAGRLREVDGKLAELDARLRYFSLEIAVRPTAPIDGEKLRSQLEELDAEIGRCRVTLSDLQSREATVRRELAEVHADGRADGADALVDQRATLGVLERLLNDLDAEVSQLARAHEPGRCVGCDAHGRISPVAQLLRHQLYALCGQVSEQQRTVRRVQLEAESRQLSRAQTDLSERLEHLLQRRQAAVHQSQLNSRPLVVLPQSPAAELCSCEQHGEFVRRADSMVLGAANRSRQEADARQQRIELEQQQRQLRSECDELAREIESLQTRWQQLQRDRAQTVTRSRLDELRAELERLEVAIQRAIAEPNAAASPSTPGYRPVWKASDVLAQLTDGELTQIRLGGAGGTAVVDRMGRPLVIRELTAAQHDQLYLALTLALATSLAARRIELPLVLDEPFLRQDAAGAAAMAGVLLEFSRQHQQAVVITKNEHALRRFAALGADVRDIDQLRRQATLQTEPVAAVVPPAAAEAAASTLRLVRETVGEAAPELRLADQWTQGDEEPIIYYLSTDAALADFPVLGNDTGDVFASLGIRNVDDLLAADAADVARRLKRPTITADAVRLWQTHMSLMCFVPSLSLNDAQVLAACEVTTPEALYSIDVRLLGEAVGRFAASSRGRRFATACKRLTRERLADLQKLARRQRVRWLQANERYRLADRQAEPVAQLTPRRATRTRSAKVAAAERQPRRTKRPLEFLLQRNSPATAAPSINAATGERLAGVGIRTIADLLAADPQSAADELGDARFDAATIARWQSESRLACRIPGLPRYAARLLAACDLTEAEQVAGANAAELVTKIGQLCRKTNGRRLLGNHEPPTRTRVGAWIRLAGQMRPLEAA
jgi:energy-coupling factor transporter ATP-binding protein EcfA2